MEGRSTDSILNTICQKCARTHQAQLCAIVTETAGISKWKNEFGRSDCSSFDFFTFFLTVALLLWNLPQICLFCMWHKCVCVCFTTVSCSSSEPHSSFPTLQYALFSEDNSFVSRSSFKLKKFKLHLINNASRLHTFPLLVVHSHFQ